MWLELEAFIESLESPTIGMTFTRGLTYALNIRIARNGLVSSSEDARACCALDKKVASRSTDH
jgi:hypothetical protein